jgi:lysophospholipase L1-like esterase
MRRVHLIAFLFAAAFVLAAGGTVYAGTKTESKSAVVKDATAKTPDDVVKEKVVLEKPVLSCTGTTATKVTLTWKKISGAARYYILRAKEKDGTYTQVGTTKKLTFTDKTAKSSRTYYYKIYAAGKNGDGKRILSKYSKKIAVTTKKKVKKTAYAGDSVMSGLAVYNIVTAKNKKVVYKVGCSEYTFYNGATMDTLLDYDPDRLFIMLGMNSLSDSPGEKAMNRRIGYYKDILKECLKQNPDLQIIVLPVSPTRPTASVKNSDVNKYNAKLKKMAEDLGVYYYDYTSFLKDSDGYLKSSGSAKDGIHWTKATYRTFLDKLDSYGETLD